VIDTAAFGIIYLTSRVSGGQVVRRYVGQHRVRRGVIEDGYLGSGKILTAAIRKHGREAFVRETLQICYSREELNEAEKHWVMFFDAVRSPEFYNIAEGGLGQNSKTRKPVFKFGKDGRLLAEFDSVASAAESVGCAESQITLACKNPRRTACGFGWSFAKDRVDQVKVGVSRAVQMLDVDGRILREFPSVTDACRSLGVRNTANLSACCSGSRKSFRGFRWKHADGEIPKTAEPRQDGRIFVATNPDGTETRYRGLPDIRNRLGGSAVCNVLACCAGRRKITLGATWRIE
jgi:hypothetical protein